MTALKRPALAGRFAWCPSYLPIIPPHDQTHRRPGQPGPGLRTHAPQRRLLVGGRSGTPAQDFAADGAGALRPGGASQCGGPKRLAGGAAAFHEPFGQVGGVASQKRTRSTLARASTPPFPAPTVVEDLIRRG
eukprot:gene22891-43294_t